MGLLSDNLITDDVIVWSINGSNQLVVCGVAPMLFLAWILALEYGCWIVRKEVLNKNDGGL